MVGTTPDGTVIFTVTMDSETGEYTITMYGPVDHGDFDVGWLIFGVNVTDADGDVKTTFITLDVHDDTPDIGPDFARVDETNLDGGPLQVSGDLDVDFGADGAGSVEPSGQFYALHEVGGDPQPVTAGGELVTVTATADGYVGMTESGEIAFTLTLDSTTGEYTYTQYISLDQPDGMDPNDAIGLIFGVQGVDGDGDVVTTQITIVVHDDGPTASAQGNGVSEDGLAGGPVVVENTLNFDFGEDGAGSVAFSGDVMFKLDPAGAPIQLTSGGEPVTFAFDADGVLVGTTPDGTVVFTASMDPETGGYNITMYGPVDHGDFDVGWLIFGVNVTDGDGDVTQTFVTLDVHDAVPVANDDCVEFDIADGSVGGDVTDNDEFSPDVQNSVVQIKFGGETFDIPTDGSDITIEGEYGTLTINSAGEYTYVPFDGVFDGETASLDPTQADAEGIQTSFTNNGITVTIANEGNYDISWVNTSDGSGFGIDNLDTNDSKKVFPSGEAFNIAAESAVTAMTITISELGDNNDDGNHGLDYIVTLADGTQVAMEQQFVPGQIIDGHFTFTIDSSMFGQDILSVEISSTNAGDYYGASFLLNNVSVEYPGTGSITDIFEYVLQDGDGDTDTALLKIEATDNGSGGPICEYQDADFAKVLEFAAAKHIVFDEVLSNDTSDAEIFLFDATARQKFDVANDMNFSLTNNEYDSLSKLISHVDPLTEEITSFVIATEANQNSVVPQDMPVHTNIIEIAKVYAVDGVSLAGDFDNLQVRDDSAIL